MKLINNQFYLYLNNNIKMSEYNKNTLIAGLAIANLSLISYLLYKNS
jgi:hypothetical protein